MVKNILVLVTTWMFSFYAFAFDYLPKGSGEVVNHAYFSLSYIENHELSEWVAHKLTKRSITGRTKRTNNFRFDPKVSTKTVNGSDYRKSGFDRGHMVPAGDMKLNRTAMSESFYMSNIAPQRASFNRGIWRSLEERIRSWVRAEGQMYVITGPVLERGLPPLNHSGVSVPSLYYKIVLSLNGKPKMIGFLFENYGSKQPLRKFAVSVDSIEQMTGIDFFPALADDLESQLESQVRIDRWHFRK